MPFPILNLNVENNHQFLCTKFKEPIIVDKSPSTTCKPSKLFDEHLFNQLSIEKGNFDFKMIDGPTFMTYNGCDGLKSVIFNYRCSLKSSHAHCWNPKAISFALKFVIDPSIWLLILQIELNNYWFPIGWKVYQHPSMVLVN